MSSFGNKPIASLSLDLDNKWSYMKTHGDAGWESFPSYLDVVVPRSLSFFRDRGLTITYFIVGQDAALDKNHDALGQITADGHEAGNHSFNHEPWLHLYSKDELVNEFSRAEDAIELATGARPIGFRGPGFSMSETVMEVLGERGYKYDCSTFPTYLGPLARAYYFMKSGEMTEEEKEKRKGLFGKFSDGFRTLKPHFVKAAGRDLLEIPVTTLPLFKTPIHASYVIYLATFSKIAARTYWRNALRLCKLSGTQPSLLLHPLDFLGAEDAPELAFFPGMNMPVAAKLEIMDDIIRSFAERFNLVNMNGHADHVLENTNN